MRGFSISFEVQDGLSAALVRGIDAGRDMTPAMKAIAVHLETTTKERFDREESPSGAKWKPSARAIEEDGQTLTLSRDLRTSIQPRWDAQSAMVGPEKSFGAAIYAAIHQFGGVILPRLKKALSFGGRVVAKVVMPARAYLGIDAANRDEIGFILGDFLRGAIGGAR